MKTKFTHGIGICFCFVASVVCAGAHGVVEVDSVETDIGGGLVILPDELKGRTVNLAERCALQLQGDVSSFFINGQGARCGPGKTTSRKPFIGNEVRNSSGFVLFETRSI